MLSETLQLIRTVDLRPCDVTTTLEKIHGRRTVARVYANGERGIVGNRPLYNVEFTDGTGNSGNDLSMWAIVARAACEYADRREATFAAKCADNYCPCAACDQTRKAMN